MKLLLDSNSVVIFPGLNFTLTDEGVFLGEAINTQYTTANSTAIDADPPPVLVSGAYQWQNNAWVCIDQAAVDQFVEQQKSQFNYVQSNKRLLAYTAEADGIYFKWQRQEATQQEWLDKVNEIKARYPYVT